VDGDDVNIAVTTGELQEFAENAIVVMGRG